MAKHGPRAGLIFQYQRPAIDPRQDMAGKTNRTPAAWGITGQDKGIDTFRSIANFARTSFIRIADNRRTNKA
jgi:hypothetical protein